MTKELKTRFSSAGWVAASGQDTDSPVMFVRGADLKDKEPINWILSDDEAKEKLHERVKSLKEYAEKNLAESPPDRWVPK